MFTIKRGDQFTTTVRIKNVTSPTVPIAIVGGYGVDSVTKKSIDLIDTTGGTLFNAPDHVVEFVSQTALSKSDVVVLNNNIKKASILIPATENVE